MSREIFISYSRDDRERVGLLARALQSQGWQVWWDPDILPGATFDREIDTALAAAKVVVVVWSKVSIDRDWVLNEADEGRRRNILVPVFIDPINIPLGFRRIQAADLTKWNGEPNHPDLAKLFTRIQKMLSNAALAPADAVAPDAVPFGTPRASRRGLFLISAAVAAVLLLAGGLLVNRMSEPQTTVQGIRDCETCPELSLVPAGDFLMGAAEGEPFYNPAQSPKHKVVISKPILIGRYEVKVAEYAEFIRAQGQTVQGADCEYYDYRSGRFRQQPNSTWKNPPIFVQQNDHPVVCVNWFDAKSYLAWLSRKTGKRYRLPSEAEWEYAARAGTKEPWQWGANAKDACGFGNVSDESSRRRTEFNWEFHPCDDGYPFTAPAGSFQPNGFGLHDMIGNAWEWVEDCYIQGYDNAPGDGAARLSDTCEERVLRGASWLSRPLDTPLAARGRNDPKRRFYAVGFRVVRDP